MRHPVPLLKVNRVSRGVGDAGFARRIPDAPAVARAAKAPDAGLDGAGVGNIPGRHPVIQVQLLKRIKVPRIPAMAECSICFITHPGCVGWKCTRFQQDYVIWPALELSGDGKAGRPSADDTDIRFEKSIMLNACSFDVHIR